MELDPPLLAQPVSSELAAIGISTRQAVIATRAARIRSAGLRIAAIRVTMQNSKASEISCNICRLAGGCVVGSDCGTIMLAAVVATVTEKAAGVPGVSETVAGALQVALEGAPEQAKLMLIGVVEVVGLVANCRL